MRPGQPQPQTATQIARRMVSNTAAAVISLSEEIVTERPPYIVVIITAILP